MFEFLRVGDVGLRPRTSTVRALPGRCILGSCDIRASTHVPRAFTHSTKLRNARLPPWLGRISTATKRKMSPKIYYAPRYYSYPNIDLLSLLFGKFKSLCSERPTINTLTPVEDPAQIPTNIA